MNHGIRSKIIYFSQIAIGLVLVIWIMMQVDRQKFVDYFVNLSLSNFLLVVILAIVSLFFQFRRWRNLVEQYSMHFNFKDLLPSFLAGFTFRLIIPGGPAELSKIYLLPGKKRGKVLAFGMERVFLTFIKLLAILIVFPLTFPQYTIYCSGLLIVLGLVYFFFPRLPALKSLQEKDVNYHRVFAINAFFSSVAFLVMGLQYYLLLNQTTPISLAHSLQTTVYLWSSGLVPISVSGLGVREGLAVYFFRMYDVPAAYAVATSLFLFTINSIFPALSGTYFIYKNRSHFAEIKNSVKSPKAIISILKGDKNAGDEGMEG
jgi:uncharacterized membrane protein YbhN (UPF0104 family)